MKGHRYLEFFLGTDYLEKDYISDKNCDQWEMIELANLRWKMEFSDWNSVFKISIINFHFFPSNMDRHINSSYTYIYIQTKNHNSKINNFIKIKIMISITNS